MASEEQSRQTAASISEEAISSTENKLIDYAFHHEQGTKANYQIVYVVNPEDATQFRASLHIPGDKAVKVYTSGDIREGSKAKEEALMDIYKQTQYEHM